MRTVAAALLGALCGVLWAYLINAFARFLLTPDHERIEP